MSKKELEKNISKIIRSSAKANGYKTRDSFVYKKEANAFVFACGVVTPKKGFHYYIWIKEYDYDDIFWDIMQMSDNKKESDSLRAVGAFSVPGIILKDGFYDIDDSIDKIGEVIIQEMEELSQHFLKNNSIDEYIITHNEGVDDNMLKCLAYLHMNKPEKALKIARDSVEKGNHGGFYNEGKWFFEWVICMYEK